MQVEGLKVANSKEQDQGSPNLVVMNVVMILAPVAALIALVLTQFSGVWAAIGVGIVIYLAAAAIGGAIGFLFALPRVLGKDPAADTVLASESASVSSQAKRLLQTNTNLERVSDWLTTMLVGVGLTQLNAINDGLDRFRQFVADTAKVFPCSPNVTDTPICVGSSAGFLPAVAPLLLIIGLVIGFLGLYVYTRLRLASAFHDLENKLLGEAAGQAVRAAAQELSATSDSPVIKSIASGAAPSVDAGLSLMLNLLYQPGRYQRVIDLGGLLTGTDAARRPEFWFYLAAAFGQKYHDLLQSKISSDQERLSVRLNVIDCARRAVELDSSFKYRLASIAVPGGADDDLADFHDDAEFRGIAGMV